MTLLHSITPELISEPIAWGTYTSDPTAHFFACRYVAFTLHPRPAPVLTSLVAQLHSRAVSPTGGFGSLQVTYGGCNPLFFPRSASWGESFPWGLDAIFTMEEETHGVDAKMTRLREGLMTKVIPRILRPLETEGRVPTPRLAHGAVVGRERSGGRAERAARGIRRPAAVRV